MQCKINVALHLLLTGKYTGWRVKLACVSVMMDILRIPMISACDSDHASRAGYLLLWFLTRLIGLRQFSHRFSFELYPVTVMQKSVHQRIRNCRVTHQFVPFVYDYATSSLVAVFHHLPQV
jgi:hypothetical protein